MPVLGLGVAASGGSAVCGGWSGQVRGRVTTQVVHSGVVTQGYTPAVGSSVCTWLCGW
jgi:hypothetical protein